MSADVEQVAERAGAVLPGSELQRGGVRHWLRSFAFMLRFDYANIRSWAVMIFIVQLMMGVGMAVMYGFFYPDVTPTTALLITTGVPTLALIPLGFVLIPGSVGQQRLEGTFDFIWSLPVPRSAQVAATFALYSGLALPGTVLALVVGCWRYGVSLAVSPLVVPAVLLSALMAVAVGFGMALLVAQARYDLTLTVSPAVVPAALLTVFTGTMLGLSLIHI